MKVDSLDGDVTEDTHKKWIELNSLQFGVGRAITTRSGGGEHRDASLPSVSEVVVSKHLDPSSVPLFKWSVGGTDAKTVKIELVSAGGAKAYVYEKIELTECLISSYSLSSGGDKPSESVSLNFTKVQVTYTPTDTKGNPSGKNIVASYDIAKANPA